MAGSTTKKAIVRRFDREPLAGYVNPLSFLQSTGVELLSADGNIVTVPYEDVRSVCFVRDLEAKADAARQTFNTRPKMEGLWVSLRFRDGEIMEGILVNNLLQVEPQGFSMIPPDPNSNNQRIFVPRAALRSVEVLGVVGSPLKRRKTKAAPEGQIELFEK
jgi:hypothetical protein